MTKEELLQKGVSEGVADEIVAAFEENSGPENSIELLEKALSKDFEEEDLFKAQEDDEDEEREEDDYDEAYMKKYMKRYMMANKKATGKMAKELGIMGGEMKKAIDDFDISAEGAVVEMADLKPILEAQKEYIDSLSKAVEDLSDQVTVIASQQAKSFDIMEKAARVQVVQAKAMDEFLGKPQGRKGVVANADLQKASTPHEIAATPEQTKEIYQALMKATRNGNRDAGAVISVFESSGQNIKALSEAQRRFVFDLMTTKEVQ